MGQKTKRGVAKILLSQPYSLINLKVGVHFRAKRAKDFFFKRFCLEKRLRHKKSFARTKKKLKEVQLFSTVTSNLTNGSASFFD